MFLAYLTWPPMLPALPCPASRVVPACLPADIRESIKQLQYYRKNIFIKWSGPNLP